MYITVHKDKNNIYCKYIDGTVIKHTFDKSYVPILWEEKQDAAYAASSYVSFYNRKPCQPVKFKNLFDFYQASPDLHGNRNVVTSYIYDIFYKNNTNPLPVELKDLTYGSLDIEVLSESGFPDPEKADWPISSVAIILNRNNVVSVQNKNTFTKFVYLNTELCSVQQLEKLQQNINHNFNIIFCENEKNLLSLITGRIASLDILTGWNSNGFDIPYLINRAEKLGIKKESFSPFNIVQKTERQVKNTRYTNYEIFGVSCLDYMELFKKFGYVYGPQDSYKLDNIANVVLGKKKLSYSEYGNLYDLFKNDLVTYLKYNYRDAELVFEMQEKLQYIDIAMGIAYKAGTNYVDSLATVPVWDAMINKELMNAGVIPPPKKDMSEEHSESYEGGYVKEPLKGVFKDIISFDIGSLYPNIIVNLNMSPETIHPNLKIQYPSIDEMIKESFNQYDTNNKDLDIKLNYIRSATGCVFTVPTYNAASGLARGGTYSNKGVPDLGIIPFILQKFISERALIKQNIKSADLQNKEYIQKLENKQHVIKILMNSLYGAYANKYFRYYNRDIAESITMTGQLIIRALEAYINTYTNFNLETESEKDFVIASDTDSIYLHAEDLLKNPHGSLFFNDLDAIIKYITEDIFPLSLAHLAYHWLYPQNYGNNAHSYKQLLKFTLNPEVYAESGCWTAAKNYFLRVLWKNGKYLPRPEMKIMGLSSIKSSTPLFLRNNFENVYDVALTEGRDGIEQIRQMLYDLFKDLDETQIAVSVSVNNLEKYYDPVKIYTKGTPIHVRAALLYNHHIEKNKLTGKYRKISSGDKMKYIFLKLPNPIHEDVIGFPDILPPELGLHSYMDYDIQFTKGFDNPMNIMTDAMGMRRIEFNQEASLLDLL